MTVRRGPRSVEAEHIVVGAGAAGCAFAARLSRTTGAPVLLLEAGPADRDPRLRVPLAFARLLDHDTLTWRYPVEAGEDTPAETWVRGRTLGGSTAINGHLHLRATHTDLRDLAAAVDDPWWEPSALDAAADAVEDRRGPVGAGTAGGTSRGPVPVVVPAVDGPVVAAVLAAAAAGGVRTVPAADVGEGPRLGPAPVTIDRGRRVSAARAFLPHAGPGLQVRTGCEVDRLLFAGDRVVGVRCREDGQVVDHRARGEVIVCAGALETPRLLQRSGIGPEAVLRAAGIEVRVAAPQVGRGLREPRAVTVVARLRDGLGRTPALASGPRRAAALVRYLATRGGPLARAPFELAGSVATGAGAAVVTPDAHVLVGTLCPGPDGLEPADHAGIILQGYAARPSSTGSVEVTGVDGRGPARIVLPHLATAADRATSIGVLTQLRAWLTSPPLADLVRCELLPGTTVRTDAEVVADTRRRGAGIYHAVGTCAAGPGDEHVVDGQLRVRGATGLRVVDASVFPFTPSAGTAAPTAALAWRAAELFERTGRTP